MKKLTELYRGKAKTVFTTSDPDLLILEFRNDTSAFDGEKIEQLERKGMINNKLNFFIMNYLEQHGVKTQAVKLLSDNELLVKKLDMIPVECVVRNRAAGSITRRLGVKEGTIFNPPTFELFLKNDALHDPMINESHCESFKLATKAQLDEMKTLSLKINQLLSELFLKADLVLVDFKLEFGLYKNEIILGDEFSPDGCRLWETSTLKKMDKDRFRQGLGGVIEAYEEVAKRIGVKL